MKKLIIAVLFIVSVASAQIVTHERVCNVVHNLQNKTEVFYCINTSDAIAYERIVFQCFDVYAPTIKTVMKNGNVIFKHYEEIPGDMYDETLVKDDDGTWVSVRKISLKLYQMYVPLVHRKNFCKQQREKLL